LTQLGSWLAGHASFAKKSTNAFMIERNIKIVNPKQIVTSKPECIPQGGFEETSVSVHAIQVF
jgi:hypothetical protein